MTRTRELGFRPELNGLRGVAISIVIATHVDNAGFPGGELGVDIFFVLSGFLITSLLMVEWDRAKTIHLQRFWIRRVLRLVPALVAFLGVATVAALATGEGVPLSFRSAAVSALYLTDIVRAGGGSFSPAMGHLWSLAVEEQFYLVWPLVFLALMRNNVKRRTILAVTMIPVVIVPIWRAILYYRGASYDRIKLAPDTRADILVVGCVLALLYTWDLAPWLLCSRFTRIAAWPAAGFLGGWVLFGAAASDLGALSIWGYSTIAVCAAILVVNALDDRSVRFRRALSWRPLVWLGRVSYAVYLWHPLTILVADRMFPSHNAVLVGLVAVPSALAISEASWRLIETPFLRRKARFAASPVRSGLDPAGVLERRS